MYIAGDMMASRAQARKISMRLRRRSITPRYDGNVAVTRDSRISNAVNEAPRSSDLGFDRIRESVGLSIVNMKEFFTERNTIDLHVADISYDAPEEEEEDVRIIGSTFEETYEINREWLYRLWRLFLFLAIGLVIFCITEGWGFQMAVYFLVQTISTVGYGNITPKTRIGQAATIFYILIGILLTFTVIGDIVRFLVIWVSSKYSRSRKLNRFQLIIRSVVNCLYWISLLFMVFIFGALVFAYNENWPFVTALYFSAYTCASVGYGDLSLQKDSSIWFNIFFILASVSFTAIALEKIASFKRHLEKAELKQILNDIDLNRELLEAIDKKGHRRVSQSDYILHMLQLEGKLVPNDLVPWLRQFHDFDVDKDGLLTTADIQLFQISDAKKERDKLKLKGEQRSNDNLMKQLYDELVDIFLETIHYKKEEVDAIDKKLESTTVTSPMVQLKLLRKASLNSSQFRINTEFSQSEKSSDSTV